MRRILLGARPGAEDQVCGRAGLERDPQIDETALRLDAGLHPVCEGISQPRAPGIVILVRPALKRHVHVHPLHEQGNEREQHALGDDPDLHVCSLPQPRSVILRSLANQWTATAGSRACFAFLFRERAHRMQHRARSSAFRADRKQAHTPGEWQAPRVPPRPTPVARPWQAGLADGSGPRSAQLEEKPRQPHLGRLGARIGRPNRLARTCAEIEAPARAGSNPEEP